MYLLLIEDSCPVVERLGELFSTHPVISGFLSVAGSEVSAELLEEFIPDIILLGVTYPVAVSFSLLTGIRSYARPEAVIMLDTGTDEYIHQQFFRHGATHVLDTYNDFGQLLSLIDAIACRQKNSTVNH